MLGVTRQPTRVDDMLLPPEAFGVLVVSIGMFVPPGQPVVWRGPMLHRALQQFLADVFWGDLDVLLLDLPPGTGDIAISVAQLLPSSEIVVVTTPQVAAAEVAERAGSVAVQTRQHVVGVVENMSWLEQPDGSRLDVFGTGGGQTVADNLTRITGGDVPLLGQVAAGRAPARGRRRGHARGAQRPRLPRRPGSAGRRPLPGCPPPRPRGPVAGPDSRRAADRTRLPARRPQIRALRQPNPRTQAWRHRSVRRIERPEDRIRGRSTSRSTLAC